MKANWTMIDLVLVNVEIVEESVDGLRVIAVVDIEESVLNGVVNLVNVRFFAHHLCDGLICGKWLRYSRNETT